MSFEDFPCVLLGLEAVLPQSGLWVETGSQCVQCRAKDWGCLSPRRPLTQLHRSTWKMEPSLPPQNMWCSARSMVTDMMPMSNNTDSSRSPEEMAQSCRDGKPGTVDTQAHSQVGGRGGMGDPGIPMLPASEPHRITGTPAAVGLLKTQGTSQGMSPILLSIPALLGRGKGSVSYRYTPSSRQAVATQ